MRKTHYRGAPAGTQFGGISKHECSIRQFGLRGNPVSNVWISGRNTTKLSASRAGEVCWPQSRTDLNDPRDSRWGDLRREWAAFAPKNNDPILQLLDFRLGAQDPGLRTRGSGLKTKLSQWSTAAVHPPGTNVV